MIKNKKGHFDFATLVISIVGGIIGYIAVTSKKIRSLVNSRVRLKWRADR